MPRASGGDISAEREECRLIERAQQGDERAFEQLFEQHKRGVFGVVFGMVPDRDEAEGETLAVFVRAHRALRTYDGRSSFFTWLRVIAVRHCQNVLRDRARRANVTPVDDDVLHLLAGADSAPQPDEVLLRNEQSQAVLAALDELPERLRCIVDAFYLQEMTESEVAAKMQLPIGTVRRLKHEGKTKLRTLLCARVDGDGVTR